jgi:hypothetical protein
MELDSGSVTAALHGCRSAVGADCEPADAWSSPISGVWSRQARAPAFMVKPRDQVCAVSRRGASLGRRQLSRGRLGASRSGSWCCRRAGTRAFALGELNELGIGYGDLYGLLDLGVDRLAAAGAPERGEGAEDCALHELRWTGEDDRLAELGSDHGELQRVGHPLGVRAVGAREAQEDADQVEEALPRIDLHQHGGRRAARVPPVVHRAGRDVHHHARGDGALNPIELHRERSGEDAEALMDAWMEVFPDDSRLGP